MQVLLDGLLLDLEHPQITDPNTDWEAVKAPIQSTHAACLQQLALYGPGRDALRARPDALEALRSVAQQGWSSSAQKAAEGAMKALSDHQTKRQSSPDRRVGGHIMLSYCWAQQPMIKRINSSVKQRGYTTWIDIEDMRGSTVDAMSDAVRTEPVVTPAILGG